MTVIHHNDSVLFSVCFVEKKNSGNDTSDEKRAKKRHNDKRFLAHPRQIFAFYDERNFIHGRLKIKVSVI
jgi:hypothetical protein